jgi:hypothetical protein
VTTDTQKRPAIFRLQVQRNYVKTNYNFFKQAIVCGKLQPTHLDEIVTAILPTLNIPLTATTYDVGGEYVTSLVCVTVT